MYKMIAFSTLAAFCVAGCKKKTDEAGSTTGSSTAPMTQEDKGSAAKSPEPAGPVTINGSGSTFQKQFQELAIEGFSKVDKDVKVNYGSGGSGKGRQDFSDMVTDYGCTDGLFKEADAAKAKGGQFLYFPILLGAITVSYNVDGIDKLQLSGPTIAKIFQREIKKWNDKEIAADNPGVKLPSTDIVVAHRSDGSGTTEQFTLYLNTATPDIWKLKSGATVEWPADTQAGNGNGGVAQIIKSTKGAIGYVDLPDAQAARGRRSPTTPRRHLLVRPAAQTSRASQQQRWLSAR